MLFKQLCDMISSLSCHADTILDHILTQMDEKVISVKKLRKAVAKLICSRSRSILKVKHFINN